MYVQSPTDHAALPGPELSTLPCRDMPLSFHAHILRTVLLAHPALPITTMEASIYSLARIYGVYISSNIALLPVCIDIPSTRAFIRDVRSRGRQAGKRRPTRCCHRGLPEAGGLYRSIRRSRWHGSFQPKCRFSKKKQEKKCPQNYSPLSHTHQAASSRESSWIFGGLPL